jgi:hypothetical protein
MSWSAEEFTIGGSIEWVEVKYKICYDKLTPTIIFLSLRNFKKN